MSLRAWTALASLAVGLVNGGAGVAHAVGVTNAALARDGLFDARHTTLLVIAWTLLAPAAALLAGAYGMWRGRAWGYAASFVAGFFLLVEFALLGGALGTPAQTAPALAGAVAFLVLVGVAWKRRGSEA